jgi:Putative binding domain, N-terminal/Galactose oxidase, central domain/Kelch motif
MVAWKNNTRLITILLILFSGPLSIFCFAWIPSYSEPVNSHFTSTPKRQITIEERVQYQAAIEQVYWKYRFWPSADSVAKPRLDAVLSTAQIEEKVMRYLKTSETLERNGQTLAPQQLQAEITRMANQTRRPEMLRELWAVLGNDPFIIAECLARPVLLDRLRDRAAPNNSEAGGTISSHPDSTARSDDYALKGVALVSRPTGFEYRLANIATQSSSCSDNTWTFTNPNGAPSQRYGHSAVWTGSEMIVWGGYQNGRYFNDGARYDPATDTWFPTTISGAPSPRRYHAAVWSGFELLVWGGSSPDNLFTGDGARYNPMTNSWTRMSQSGALSGRYAHSGIWSGTEIIIWGGTDGNSLLNSGARYDPYRDTWTATTTSGAPEGRRYHSVVWTGSEMIVWGGEGGTQLNTGSRYNPRTDTWSATSTLNAPSPRDSHTAVYTGSEMIVWGGSNANYPYYLSTGARYSPSTNSWSPIDTSGAPAPRSDHTAIWTGNEMILWGGASLSGTLNTGGRYDPASNIWKTTNTSSAPSARYFHTAVWTGNEMIIYGASSSAGGRYCASEAASTCSYSISPTSAAYPSSGGSGSVTVTTTSGCPWNASSNAGWITVSSGSSGSGSSTYSVAANSTGSPRTGSLTVAGQTVSITQEGSSPTACSYSISPESKVFRSRGGSGSFSVFAPAGCGWTASTSASWITISSGSGSGNGTVNYSVPPNPNSSVRKGTIVVGGQVFFVKQRGG